MVYVIASKEKAAQYGFVLKYHRTNSTQVILNNKEVVISQALTGDFDERVKLLDGEVYGEKELLFKLNDWLKK